jgi:hypothetical protein
MSRYFFMEIHTLRGWEKVSPKECPAYQFVTAAEAHCSLGAYYPGMRSRGAARVVDETNKVIPEEAAQ